MLAFVIFAVTFVAFMFFLVFYLSPGSKPRPSTIPGPDPSDPKEGNLPDIAQAGSLHEYLEYLHSRYGPIVSFWMGERYTVSIASPELFKEHIKPFDRPVELFKLFEPLITPHSIQYANGEDGKSRRSLYDASFGHMVVKSFIPIFHQVADKLVSRLSSLTADEHFPVGECMFDFAIESILNTSFGCGVMKKDETQEFKKLYDICWAEMEARLTEGPPTAGSERETRFEQSQKRLHQLVSTIINERRRQRQQGNNDRDTFLDVLLDAAGGASDDMADSVIFADALSYIIGGFHTTGNFLTWALYYLAKHKDVQDKTFSEIERVLGDRRLDEAALRQLTYLDQVINETLRCSVLAPWAARFQDVDAELGGHIVPKGTPVIHALGVVLQDEKIWPEPEWFDPERFSPENSKGRHSLAYAPFGFAGKRICPGYRFAAIESLVALTRLLQEFELFLVADEEQVEPVFGLVTHPLEEIWLTLKKRKQ